MIKIFFVAHYFPPIGGAGVQRAQTFAQYLPAQGVLPTVITGPGVSSGRWTPPDKSLLKSLPSDVVVHRVVGPVPKASQGVRRRLENWLLIQSPFSRWWVPTASKLGASVANGERLILATMSPFESGDVARNMSRLLKIPWVADLRDPWALDEMQVYPSKLHRTFEKVRMERVLESAALIIMNTSDAQVAVREAFPRLSTKAIITIPNGFDLTNFTNPTVPRTDNKFRIVHSGYLHTDMGLQLRRRQLSRLLGGTESGVDILTRSHTILLEAVERLCACRPEVRLDLELVFAGQASLADHQRARDSTTASLIRFTGYLSHDESLNLVRTADLLFLPMHNVAPGKRTRIVPGKAYEYMASGRPILAAVPDGDCKDLMRRCGTATICRPDDSEEMTNILDRMHQAWKTHAECPKPDLTFIAQFERRHLAHTLASGLKTVLAQEARYAR